MAGRADRLLVRLCCLSRLDAVARLARPRWVDDPLPVQVRILEIDGGACGAVLELKEERDRSGAGAARSGSSESQRALRHPTPAETRQAFAGRPHESRIRGQRVQDPATLRLPVVPSEGSLCGFLFLLGRVPVSGVAPQTSRRNPQWPGLSSHPRGRLAAAAASSIRWRVFRSGSPNVPAGGLQPSRSTRGSEHLHTMGRSTVLVALPVTPQKTRRASGSLGSNLKNSRELFLRSTASNVKSIGRMDHGHPCLRVRHCFVVRCASARSRGST